MTNPDDPAWLLALLRRSVLVPAAARRHWQRLLPLLSTAQRYELAAALLEVERWLESPRPLGEGSLEVRARLEFPRPPGEGSLQVRARLTAARQAWHRWQAAAGPWQSWSICPTLLSPEAASLPRVRPRHDQRAAHLAAAMRPWLDQPGGTLCVLDLLPTLGVQVAAQLADAAHPVLVLPRWPYAEAILPTDELLAILIAQASALPSPRWLPNVVLVLDGERSRPAHQRSANDHRADNRFPPASFELPDLATLRARDIRRIHRFSHA